MFTLNLARRHSGVLLLLAACITPVAEAQEFEFTTAADVVKISSWLGRDVVTRNGEKLGAVQDVAWSPDSRQVAYVVVSVGSFLIRDSMIAVDPSALRMTSEADSVDGGGSLVLMASDDALRRASRFAIADTWPLRAEVALENDAEPVSADEAAAEAAGVSSVPGTATISDGSKMASIEAGKRQISTVPSGVDAAGRSVLDIEVSGSPSRPESSAGGRGTSDPGPALAGELRFERLDRNADGVLDRKEIATQLGQRDRYGSVDVDGDGFIDRFEFDVFASTRRNR